jgi:hypothetical protein
LDEVSSYQKRLTLTEMMMLSQTAIFLSATKPWHGGQSSRWTFKKRNPDEKWFVVVIHGPKWNHPDVWTRNHTRS